MLLTFELSGPKGRSLFGSGGGPQARNELERFVMFFFVMFFSHETIALPYLVRPNNPRSKGMVRLGATIPLASAMNRSSDKVA